MKRKYRLIVYATVGLVIPVLSWIMFPELGAREPLAFIALVIILGGIYEIYSWKAGKK
jgi:hypothetical protein